MNEIPPRKSSKGRKIRAYSALAIVIIAVLATGWYYYKQYTKYYSTDDAYIDADRVSVSSKILGRITVIAVAEGDSVKSGELLVSLDSSDLVSQRIQSMALRDQSVAALHQAEARYELDQKNTVVQEINLAKAREDLDRATVQYEGKVIAREQFDHLKKAYEAAQAQVDAMHAQLAVGKAMVESADVSIRTATAQIGTIETQLHNTRIYAPCDGRIAKRWLLPGDVTQPGQSVLTITRDSLKWVLAFFEETKVGSIKIGQNAEFTVDAFPGVKFYGSVFNIATNTAAQFSLIPPNNASGNFTKVTQRIPLKISIQRTDSPDPAILKRLVSGMSVIVKIYK
jgi:membrane fusion protein, multidrug efflux system